MNDEERKARAAMLEAEEATQPEVLWYLSFVGAEGWRGACVVPARGLFSGTKAAWRLGCNPGGDVKAAPLGDRELPEDLVGVLLDRDGLARLGEAIDGDPNVITWGES